MIKCIIFFFFFFLPVYLVYKNFFLFRLNYNYWYFIKFIFFMILLFIYYIFYFIVYGIFFLFKNYRFYGYFYKQFKVSKLYFQHKSIYFSFWRYLTIFLISSIHNIIIFSIIFLYNKFKQLLYINNIYIFYCIFLKIKYYFYYNFCIFLIDKSFKLLIFIKYHLFYILNLDISFKILKNLKNFKFLEDPFYYRNFYIKISLSLFSFYEKNKKKIRLIIFFKDILSYSVYYKNIIRKIFFLFLVTIIHRLRLYFDINKNRGLKWLVYNIWRNPYKNKTIKNRIIFLIKILYYYCNVVFINIIYIILMSFIYFLFFIIRLLLELRYIIIYSLLLLLLLKYYWIFYYYFLVLYKHYNLYIPFNELKESSRFFNIDFIDLRNYYNLILFHNTLVDLSIYNNIFYNDLIKNLNDNLSIFGFKITSQYNINLYSCWFLNNKDSTLINKLLNIYNKIKTHKKLKKFTKFRKLFSIKVKQLYSYNKIRHRIKVKKELDIYYNGLINTGNISDKSYFYLKKGLPLKNSIRHQIAIWNNYNRFYIKKRISRKYIVYNISNYLKINKIPLKYIWIYKNDFYFQNQIKFKTYGLKLQNYFNILRVWRQNLVYLNLWYKKYKLKHKPFFFGVIYNYSEYNRKLLYKHNIPTFNWTLNRWVKRIPKKMLFDPVFLSSLEENQAFKAIIDTNFHRSRFVHHYNYLYLKIKYPYRIFNKNYIKQLQYLKILNNNIKLIKKYNYFINSKIQFNKRYYRMILESKSILLRLILNKLHLIDSPFYKNIFRNIFKQRSIYEMIDHYEHIMFNMKHGYKFDVYQSFKVKHFWNFFDYFKVNKFYVFKYKDIYKNTRNIGVYFIKRNRKDYIKFRATILRLLSLYNFYYNFESVNTKGIKSEIGNRNFFIKKRYDNLKLNWYLNIYLTNDRQNIRLFKNLKILIYFFKLKFLSYHIYCDYFINYHNSIYNKKVKTYKLKVLNKINNLKRFFFNHNKNVNGLSIFKYLNSFSLKFHIKHLLWHSPYSFFYYNNFFKIIDNEDLIVLNNSIIKNNDFKYFYEIDESGWVFNILVLDFCWETHIQIFDIDYSKYFLLFNCYLNNTYINNKWYNIFLDYELNENVLLFEDCYYLMNIIFKNNVNYKIEIYRIFINLLFQYYNNFLYRLIRYRYILDYKEYTIIKFFKRYFNFKDWFWHLYIRLRVQVYKYLYYGKIFLKRNYMKTFKLKNIYSHRIRKIKLIPLWFYFDKYIKLFVYFLLNKYYTKTFFIMYWINDYYKMQFQIIILYSYYFKYMIFKNIYFNNIIKYIKNFFFVINFLIIEIISTINNEILLENNLYLLWFKNISFNIFDYKMFYLNVNTINNIKYFYNNYILYFFNKLKYKFFSSKIFLKFYRKYCLLKWYIKSIFQFNYYYYFFINYKLIWVIFKYYFLYFNVKWIYKVNDFFLIKIYFEKIFKYYLSIFFKLKNSFIYFKPNYYFYRKQRSLHRFKYHRKRKLFILMSFLQTNVVRKISSLKHLTYNIFFFKNLYLLNLYSYIYIMNDFNFNNVNIFDIFLHVVKYNFIYIYILFYVFFYWIMLFVLFIFYKRFYNLLFFCSVINNDIQKSWEKNFLKNKSIKTVNIFKDFNKSKYFFNKVIKKYNRWYDFYNFILFKKASYFKTFIVKIFLLSSLYKKIKKLYNNNKLLNNFSNNSKVIESNGFIYKIFHFMEIYQIKNIAINKENKNYNFYFYNLMNNNLLNFCFLYWIILIPYFFFEFILLKYHLRGHIRKKRQFLILIKVFLENFKLYVKIYKYIGKGLYNRWKCKIPKNYYSTLTFRKKKKLKHGFFLKWDRYQKVVRRSSPMGSYFYWFLHINKWSYILYCFNYFFISSFFSIYYGFIYLYVFLLIFIIKYYSWFKIRK